MTTNNLREEEGFTEPNPTFPRLTISINRVEVTSLPLVTWPRKSCFFIAYLIKKISYYSSSYVLINTFYKASQCRELARGTELQSLLE